MSAGCVRLNVIDMKNDVRNTRCSGGNTRRGAGVPGARSGVRSDAPSDAMGKWGEFYRDEGTGREKGTRLGT